MLAAGAFTRVTAAAAIDPSHPQHVQPAPRIPRARTPRLHPAHKETDMDMETNDQLETKAGIPHDAVVTHGELLRAFEAFKETNDERIAGERRGGDVLVEEKLARINSSLDAH
jgi:hypothetical protein